MPKGIPRDTSTKRNILHRLKIARGHLDKVIELVEQDKYCIDVINQSLAVQSALKNTNQALLKNHLQTCVTNAIKSGQPEEAISEVMKVFEKG